MLAGRKRAERAGHGFTLTEVLVVVVVICLLAGALFAVLRSAREAAARTTCTNQLHQLAAAMDMYKQQYGALPPQFRWGTRITGDVGMVTWEEILLPHVGSEEVFLCPSHPDARPISEWPWREGQVSMFGGSYEYPQGPLQDARYREPREDPEQEEARKKTLRRGATAARRGILLVCPHHEQGRRRTDEGELRPFRCLLAHEDASVTWQPRPEGL